jgi:hypothetical protein
MIYLRGGDAGSILDYGLTLGSGLGARNLILGKDRRGGSDAVEVGRRDTVDLEEEEKEAREGCGGDDM